MAACSTADRSRTTRCRHAIPAASRPEVAARPDPGHGEPSIPRSHPDLRRADSRCTKRRGRSCESTARPGADATPQCRCRRARGLRQSSNASDARLCRRPETGTWPARDGRCSELPAPSRLVRVGSRISATWRRTRLPEHPARLSAAGRWTRYFAVEGPMVLARSAVAVAKGMSRTRPAAAPELRRPGSADKLTAPGAARAASRRGRANDLRQLVHQPAPAPAPEPGHLVQDAPAAVRLMAPEAGSGPAARAGAVRSVPGARGQRRPARGSTGRARRADSGPGSTLA